VQRRARGDNAALGVTLPGPDLEFTPAFATMVMASVDGSALTPHVGSDFARMDAKSCARWRKACRMSGWWRTSILTGETA